MRAEDEPAPSEPPEGAPVVAPYLIAWLEAQFPPPRLATSLSVDGAVTTLGKVAERAGQLQVIEYLRTLVKGA